VRDEDAIDRRRFIGFTERARETLRRCRHWKDHTAETMADDRRHQVLTDAFVVLWHLACDADAVASAKSWSFVGARKDGSTMTTRAYLLYAVSAAGS
jgi:hypothetical protein